MSPRELAVQPSRAAGGPRRLRHHSCLRWRRNRSRSSAEHRRHWCRSRRDPTRHRQCIGRRLGPDHLSSQGCAHPALAEPTRVSVGRIHFRDGDGNPSSRYFTVAAGVGADALLMSRLEPRLKRRLGYLLYMIEAFRILVTHGFPLFETVVPANVNAAVRVVDVSQLLAVRVRSFGGALRNLAPGASLRNGKLSLLAFKLVAACATCFFLRLCSPGDTPLPGSRVA